MSRDTKVGHSNRMCDIFTVQRMANSDDLLAKKIVILTENDEVPGSKFTSCPEDYTVDQLKRWLKCRGSKQSGKRQELITRVKDCIASGNHHLLDPGIDGGKWLKAKEDREHGNIWWPIVIIAKPAGDASLIEKERRIKHTIKHVIKK